MFEKEEQVDKRCGSDQGRRGRSVGPVRERGDGGIEPSDGVVEGVEVGFLLVGAEEMPDGVAERWGLRGEIGEEM